MYKRTLQATIENVAKTFPVLLLTGPRQVGKTTLLAACTRDDRGYVTLDDLELRQLARRDPALFLQTFPPPLTIDEIQYAPELFPALKMWVDRDGRNGLFWLTGSQKFHLLRGVTESLAGRVAVLDLLGFSEREKRGRAGSERPFLPTAAWIGAAAAEADSVTLREMYARIWQGSFPRLCADPALSRDIFYRSYMQTYIERDVRDLLNVGDGLRFHAFVRAAAARTGQLLNYASLARDVDVDPKTMKSWLSVLEASGLIKLLEPYHGNISKRIIKTPKLYFLDTGLAAYLTGWDGPESLEAGAMGGAILETHVFCEILKSYWHNGRYPNLYFYRDADQREIDFVFESNLTLYPVEVKKSASPGLSGGRAFAVLEGLRVSVGEGAVVCFREGHLPLGEGVMAMNVGYL